MIATLSLVCALTMAKQTDQPKKTLEFVMAHATQHQTRQEDLASSIGDLKDAALDQIEAVSAQADRIGESVTEQAKQTAEKVQEVASTVDTTVRQALKDQPMATLAVVVALGFVFGALWKSK